jgi:hypothetical protein
VLSPGAAKGCKPRLSSPLFDLGVRLMRGLNGSVWSGTSKIMHYVRTLFELDVKNPNDSTLKPGFGRTSPMTLC